MKAGPEQAQVAAQEEDAHGPPLPAHPDGLIDLIVILIDVVDQAGVSAVPDTGLDTLHQIGKEHILGAFDDKCHSAAGLLLEVLGIAVARKMVGLHHRHHLGAGLLGYVRAVVEYPGDGTHRIAGQLGDVFDGQRNSPLVGLRLFYPLTAPAATPLMMCFWQDR